MLLKNTYHELTNSQDNQSCITFVSFPDYIYSWTSLYRFISYELYINLYIIIIIIIYIYKAPKTLSCQMNSDTAT